MSELHHECGLVAVYYLGGDSTNSLIPSQGPEETSRLVPRMMLDIQNRGQLAAGITTYNPQRKQLLKTHRDLGGVSEVFRLNRKEESERLIRQNLGRAAIGHVRYATVGTEDVTLAQPFERQHLQKHKWFAFGFNGQLANYPELREEIVQDEQYHLSKETDTEIILHEISRQYSGENYPSMFEVCRHLSQRFDGAYSLVLLNACGEMLLLRDPLGVRPLCYAIQDGLFAAASESVALLNSGFAAENIQDLPPGTALTISPDGQIRKERFAESTRHAHCFFEWIYFANVASTMDGRSVYLSRKALGEELARLEKQAGIPIDKEDTIVVPVPDTSKAAADAMAFQLGIACLEGLIRNRYTGRTFIEGVDTRWQKVAMKYTPLREVLQGRRVLLVEDSIVRSTTMRILLDRLRNLGGAKEIHVRVACPPIVAPCFYGIDMSSSSELFAPPFLRGEPLSDEAQTRMAEELGADSLRYLPIESIGRAIGMTDQQLCQACITGNYPTPAGERLYQLDLKGQTQASTCC